MAHKRRQSTRRDDAMTVQRSTSKVLNGATSAITRGRTERFDKKTEWLIERSREGSTRDGLGKEEKVAGKRM